MLLSPLKISPTARFGLGGAFNIANSFYLDGVDEYFEADSLIANISSDTKGTISVVTKSVNVLPSATAYICGFGDTDALTHINISQQTDGKVQVASVISGVTKFVVRTTSAINLTSWTKIDVVQNGTQPVIYINSVAVAQSNISSSDLTIWLSTLTNADNFTVGGLRVASSSFFNYNGYYSQVSYLNTNISAAQVLAFYNSGKPKNPQNLFGSNCKFFFNPDKRTGDTAQFSVVDSINSITATSVNLDNEDLSPLTPYSDPIADLVAKYGFLNAWSAENIGINGTTTTAYDYQSEHNLSNPAVANQPTFAGGDANFNNRPTLYFTVDDYLTKAVANWRSADSSGIFVAVINGGTYYFSTNDNVNNSSWFSMYRSGGGVQGLIKNGAVVLDTVSTYSGTNVVASVGTGVEFKEFVNGVEDTNTAGAYSWLNSLPTQRDDITMGATTRLSAIYSTGYIAFVGYLPYTDDATIVNLQNELKTIFGL